MARTRTTYYRADASTDFWWATADADQFNRELDMAFVAQALDLHDHRAGRGKPVGLIDAGAITAGALASNSVATAAIQDLAVTTAKLADNAVTTGKILDGTIVGADMAAGAALANLGFTPINKAGDTSVGPLSFANNVNVALNGSGSLLVPYAGAVTGQGSVAMTRPAGIAGDFRTAQADTFGVLIHNSGTTPGYGLGVLNAAASNYDLLLSHAAATFAVPASATTFNATVGPGTAPFTASSATICPNLNAQYLNGQPSSYYGRATNEVPSGTHCLFPTGSLPAGWTRQSNLDGRILVGGGTAAGVGGITFTENAHAGGSWSVSGGAHTHTLNQHQHFHNNMPNATGVAGPGGQYVLLGIDYGANSWPSGDTATGSTGGASSWNFPTYAMVLAYK